MRFVMQAEAVFDFWKYKLCATDGKYPRFSWFRVLDDGVCISILSAPRRVMGKYVKQTELEMARLD